MRTKTKKAVIALLAMTTAIAASANLGDTCQQAAARYQEKAQVRARPGVNMYFVPKEWSVVEAFNPETGFSDCVSYLKLGGPLDQATIDDLQKQNLPAVSGWTDISPDRRPSDDNIDSLQVSGDGKYMIAKNRNSVTFATAEGMPF